MAEYTYIRTFLTSVGEYDIDLSYGKSTLLEDIYVAFPALNGVVINAEGTSVRIVTQEALSSEDTAILNNVVAAHIANNASTIAPTPYKITGEFDNPERYNINLFGLFRKDTFSTRGELINKEYYRDYDGTIYNDLVVKDDYAYTVYAPSDIVLYRDETITWYLEDNTVGHIKEIRKYYDLTNGIKEGVKRRTNLLDKAKAFGLGEITGTHSSGIPNSYYWFSTMGIEVDTYINGTVKAELIDFINNTTEPYITQNVKDGMIGILDYWT